VASVQVVRPCGTHGSVTSHTSDILFTFVLSGTVTLAAAGEGAHRLEEGDAYVVPPGLKTALTDGSSELRLLEVSLPARFETRTYPGDDLKR
jgi:uncharacterized cupin superfamily protein